MSARIIANIMGEGFLSVVRLFLEEGEQERVEFTADADIDADGANGQNGQIAAYRADNKGSEALANGGMGIIEGRVVGVKSWFKDIVLLTPEKKPLVLESGVIPSKTAYRYPGKDLDDPEAYVDSQTIPYICVPPVILQKTRGAVLGSYCKAEWRGKEVKGVVADVGPRTKIGEVSIAMADLLGMPSSPRNGGVSSATVKYTVFPGVPFVFNGNTFVLQRSNGQHVT